MNKVLYSGSEAGKPISIPPLCTTNAAFTVAIPSLPSTARPIVDDAAGACVGYVHEGAKNVWCIFDVYGRFIGIEEAPLETPIVDPYDLILIGPAVIKLVRAGFSTATRLVAERTAISATSKITGRVLPLLRGKLLGLSVKRLQFTETTVKHMVNPGRFVPIHILHLAIKYGKRMPDPRKVAGVFRYEIPMSRLVKRGAVYVREKKRWKSLFENPIGQFFTLCTTDLIDGYHRHGRLSASNSARFHAIRGTGRAVSGMDRCTNQCSDSRYPSRRTMEHHA